MWRLSTDVLFLTVLPTPAAGVERLSVEPLPAAGALLVHQHQEELLMQDQGLARRELIAAGLAGAAVALPVAALAQSVARAPDAPRSAPAAV